MTHKVNLQARIKRHSRILKDNLGNTLHYSGKKTFGYRTLGILLILFFPIYPTFSYFNNTVVSFYRGDIDEKSILRSYAFEDGLVNLNNDTLFENKDSFLSIGSLVEDDNSHLNKMIEYKVNEGDTIKLIAQKYGVSEDTILWENNLNKKSKIEVGTNLIFPPVTGVTYKVKSGDNITRIAKRYGVYTKDIIDQNNIKNNFLRTNQLLVIPGGEYIEEVAKPVYKTPTYIASTNNKNTIINKKPAASYVANAKNVKGMFPLTWHKPQSGAWGNCTYYVASYKAVNWRGNANQWLGNARAKGHPTGTKAVNGSIIVLGGRGYNLRYGHVAIVREIHKDYLIVSDMNYRKLNQVTVRKIKRYGSHVKGYIYIK